MPVRTSFNPYGTKDALVDRELSSAYEIVRLVASKMAYIEYLATSLGNAGSMAEQNADSVTITGGTAKFNSLRVSETGDTPQFLDISPSDNDGRVALVAEKEGGSASMKVWAQGDLFIGSDDGALMVGVGGSSMLIEDEKISLASEDVSLRNGTLEIQLLPDELAISGIPTFTLFDSLGDPVISYSVGNPLVISKTVSLNNNSLKNVGNALVATDAVNLSQLSAAIAEVSAGEHGISNIVATDAAIHPENPLKLVATIDSPNNRVIFSTDVGEGRDRGLLIDAETTMGAAVTMAEVTNFQSSIKLDDVGPIASVKGRRQTLIGNGVSTPTWEDTAKWERVWLGEENIVNAASFTCGDISGVYLIVSSETFAGMQATVSYVKESNVDDTCTVAVRLGTLYDSTKAMLTWEGRVTLAGAFTLMEVAYDIATATLKYENPAKITAIYKLV